jgi:hypothetical protein
MMTFVAFYKWRFGVPSHGFLRSLLWHYDMELQNLSPLGILHIATFVTLCESYMGIDPHFHLWNYFFRIWCPQDPDVELTISRGAVIHVKFRHGVDPYFDTPIPKLMKGWWKKWFYLRNDPSVPLLTFTGNCPVPLPI